MEKQKEKRIIYYKDPINDDFADIKKDPIVIDGNFKYIRKNIFWRVLSFIAYRIIMTPFSFVYSKIKFRLKTVNRNAVKTAGKSGFFIFGNHTLMGEDAFIPNVLCFPKKVFVVVNSSNISTFGTKNFILMNGAFPLPTEISGMKNFLSAMKERLDKGAVITIYPEAHSWPYYTDIRPFPASTFRYPVRYDKPAFCFTTTFQKRKDGKRPKITVYVDGPFYPDKTLSGADAAQKLRDEIYSAMKKRAENSDYEYIKYVKEEN